MTLTHGLACRGPSRVRRTGRAAMLLAWLAFCPSSPVRAQALQDLELTWEAPRECPKREAVLERLAHQRSAGTRRHGPISARALIVPVRAGYRLDLRLTASGSPAQRQLTSRDCEALAEAVAVLLALAIEAAPASTASDAPTTADAEAPAQRAVDTPAQPRGAAGVTAGSPASEPSAESSQDNLGDRHGDLAPSAERMHADAARVEAPAAQRVESATQSLSGAPAAELRLSFTFGAALRVATGMLPRSPALGLQPEIGAGLGPVRAWLGWTAWLPAAAPAEGYARARLEGRGWSADLALGLAWLTEPLLFAPVLALELGQLRVDARGIADPERAHLAWVAGGAGVRAALALAPELEIGLQALGIAPFGRPRWLVRTAAGDVAAFSSAPIGLRAGIDVSYRLR